MTFLPIAVRELRVAARKGSTFWIRTIAGLLMVGAAASLYLMMEGEPAKNVSLYLFIVLTSIAVLYGLFSGVRSTSDCLSQEKREGTLGLLFLTDLKGYDVVAGKLVANSLNSFYAVIAVLPMLTLPLLMGGITLGECGRMALVAINALFFSMSVGICVSALCRSAQQAAWITASLIALLTFAMPLWALLRTLAGATGSWQSLLLLPGTAFTYYRAIESVYLTGAAPFWFSLLTVHVAGWLALGVASFIAPRSWQERPRGTATLSWRERLSAFSSGDAAEALQFRRQLLQENAFYWLIARNRGRPAVIWGFLVLVACAWTWGLAKYRREWLNEGMYLGTALLLNFVIRCRFASEASRQLAHDRKAGALELLLCTPLTVGEIVRGHRLALLRQFLWPAVLTLALEAIFMRATLADTQGPGTAAWASVYICMMLMFVADLAAMYWVGMWQGLVAKNHGLAVNATIGRILVWPWSGFILTLVVMSIASAHNSNPPEPAWVFLLATWFLSGIAADVGFGTAARKKLIARFRLEAQLPLSRWKPWWRRLRE